MAGRWRRRLHGACGAATKSKGAPCRATAVKPGGRCKWHGGLSTGPKTPAGKAQGRQTICAAGGSVNGPRLKTT